MEATLTTARATAGVNVARRSMTGVGDCWVHISREVGDGPFALFERLAEYVDRYQLKVISLSVFGPCQLHASGLLALKQLLGLSDIPVAWLQGDADVSDEITACHALAVPVSTQVEPVRKDDRTIGYLFEDDNARYCFMTGLVPRRSRSKSAQTTEEFELMESLLKQVDMDFSNVVRTWLYLDGILSWYDTLNEARTKYFKAHNVFKNLVPASTGVGAANPSGAAILANVLAVSPKRSHVRCYAVPSPLQCPAIDYKSSFSRAVEIAGGHNRSLLISGSASIEPGGATAYVDDVARQMELTMKVIEGILMSRRMTWKDVTRSIGYFKDMANVRLFQKILADYGISDIPCILVQSHICRDDLLFEMELDAVHDDKEERV